MKKTFMLLALVLLWTTGISMAQTTEYNVVFDLTSKDTSNHATVIRWLKGISKSNPAAQMEVVLYGRSLGMVVADRSTVAKDVKALATNKNITFKVCEIAMKNQQVEKGQLLPGVQTVPDGIFEIVSKQQQGWGYIKSGM
jgi:intracellular sulfur oxidation DsrE/DsrF family protein